jgi:hypothetical protein
MERRAHAKRIFGTGVKTAAWKCALPAILGGSGSCYEGKAQKVSCIHIYPTFSLLPYRTYVADGLARRLVI